MQNKIKKYIKHTEKAGATLSEFLNEANIFAEQNREFLDGKLLRFMQKVSLSVKA